MVRVLIESVLKQTSTSQLLPKLQLTDRIIRQGRQRNKNKLPAMLIAWRQVGDRRYTIITQRLHPCFTLPYQTQVQATVVYNPLAHSVSIPKEEMQYIHRTNF